MSDYIPFDIQKEIIERVSEVKSLIRLRLVSKSWKSFIDSPQFIAGHGARITTQPPRIILRFVDADYKTKYICYVDDDNDTLTHQQEFDPIVPPLVERRGTSQRVVGISHGLWCFYTYDYSKKKPVVIWNPSVRKCVCIPFFGPRRCDFGFGVCPVNNDPTVIKISYNPWHAEVFTLSSGVWSLIPSSNMPHAPFRLCSLTPVVIDRFIYWVASDMTNYMIFSFDLITKKFIEITLPVSLDDQFRKYISISKLRDSLILYGDCSNEVRKSVFVRVMVHDGVITSFTKLFTFDNRDLFVDKLLGFRKSGEPIMETARMSQQFATLEVYESRSQNIEDLGIYGDGGSFFMDYHKETLLLLDYSDGYIFT